MNDQRSSHPTIPVVDFSALSLNHEDIPDCKQETVRKLASEIYRTFSTVGFVYLKNHGIPQEKIDSLFKVSEKFFSLPNDVKDKYARPEKGGKSKHGWVKLERERTNLERPGDLKEAFNISELTPGLPKEVPNFESEVKSFFQMVGKLALRVLTAMAIGLQVDPDIFISSHTNLDGRGGDTVLRLLHYPKLPDPSKIKPGQIRCGEHTDYGSITLLLQDNVGGLEVGDGSKEGEYIPAPPLQGTILVNIADLMQRWTSDKLKSTRHRVVVPSKEQEHPQSRYSIVFFVHPDEDTPIRCLDGSDKYTPITAGKYLQDRISEVYQY